MWIWNNQTCVIKQEYAKRNLEVWKSLLMEIIDKHAPIRVKRVGKNNSPWVTDELRRLMFERDSLKREL